MAVGDFIAGLLGVGNNKWFNEWGRAVRDWFITGLDEATTEWDKFFTNISDWFTEGLKSATTNWTNFFESIDDDYFIHAVEDQFIIKPVNQNMIHRLADVMDKSSGRIALETAAQTKPHTEIYKDEEACVIELDQFAQYRLSVCYI